MTLEDHPALLRRFRNISDFTYLLTYISQCSTNVGMYLISIKFDTICNSSRIAVKVVYPKSRAV